MRGGGVRELAPRPDAPPPRPSPRQEAVAQRLFLALAPRLRHEPAQAPPARLAPFEMLRIPGRRPGRGLDATWFPSPGGDRGSVLMLPPWLAGGRAYFHRRGRIQALRGAGYEVLTVDLPRDGRGGRFFDLAVEDAVSYLARRKRKPIHLWGVSSGGYWAHPVLARSGVVSGAFFEDVPPHLLEWSGRVAPWGRPCYAFFRHALPAAHRFLDMRAHAAAMRLDAVAYVGGDADTGVPVDEARALASAAGGCCRIVAGAGHLGAVKIARREVIDSALATFERAAERRLPAPPREAAAGPYPSAARWSPAVSRSMSSGVL